ncbi:hypothetical protein GYMLUDRAFT_49177 [Collybiopsis luxurians FD-317 M1]|uniref:Uncharacterized protein n=1 Tax=Collybiopsis luxurians FD-317 M1 TaxID=944289 RepID=A0A0D0BW45_9AGAR|nr:hypothetical protein GYMLUDRAFT_49177 [Collybiopsis luxurians FD-317 M1]
MGCKNSDSPEHLLHIAAPNNSGNHLYVLNHYTEKHKGTGSRAIFEVRRSYFAQIALDMAIILCLLSWALAVQLVTGTPDFSPTFTGTLTPGDITTFSYNHLMQTVEIIFSPDGGSQFPATTFAPPSPPNDIFSLSVPAALTGTDVWILANVLGPGMQTGLSTITHLPLLATTTIVLSTTSSATLPTSTSSDFHTSSTSQETTNARRVTWLH